MNYEYFHGFFILLFSACIINKNLAKADMNSIIEDRHPSFKNVKSIKWNTNLLTEDAQYVERYLFKILNELLGPSDILLTKSDSSDIFKYIGK